MQSSLRRVRRVRTINLRNVETRGEYCVRNPEHKCVFGQPRNNQIWNKLILCLFEISCLTVKQRLWNSWFNQRIRSIFKIRMGGNICSCFVKMMMTIEMRLFYIEYIIWGQLECVHKWKYNFPENISGDKVFECLKQKNDTNNEQSRLLIDFPFFILYPAIICLGGLWWVHTVVSILILFKFHGILTMY